MTNDGTPKDHVDGEGVEGRESLETHLKSKSTWLRGLFMLIMMVLFSLACMVGLVVVILQFFWVLFTGEKKAELARVGRQLGNYAAQTFDYLSFNTEERPFPFDREWPS
jgi:hypothetical protein